MNTQTDTLNPRGSLILKLLIESYIRDGQPVGSQTIAKQSNELMSSATVRKVLVDLEERGLVLSPHTSAGRVPTDMGYRFFVDSLLTMEPLDEQTLSHCRQALSPHTHSEDLQNLLESTSSLLSQLTQFAAVVTVPRSNTVILQQLDLLPLSDDRILVILVVNGEQVQNRIISTQRAYSREELTQISRYLNDMYQGQDLTEIRQGLLLAMQNEKDHMDKLMQQAVDVAKVALDPVEPAENYVMTGHKHLLDGVPFSDMGQVQLMLEAFSQKQDVLHVLDQCLSAEGVNLFIGHECGSEAFGDCSFVTAPYTLHDEAVGVLGVIGPTRMAYDRIIPVVSGAASLLSEALKKLQRPSPEDMDPLA